MSRPSMADTPAEVAAIMGSLPGRLRPDRVPDYKGVFHWTISGAPQEAWTVLLDNGQCTVSQGHDGEPDCTIKMSQKTFVLIETGKRNPVMAFVKGKIKVTNVGAMRRYDRAFYRFHDVPADAEAAGAV